jgi:hypothetical protein
MRVDAVVVADTLATKTGWPRQQADRAVGEALHKAGFPVGKVDTTPGRAVATWRYKLNRRSCPPELKAAYEAAQRPFVNLPVAADDKARIAPCKNLIDLLAWQVQASRLTARSKP